MLSNGRSLLAEQSSMFENIYHIKESIIPEHFCNKIIKDGELATIKEAEIADGNSANRSSKISWLNDKELQNTPGVTLLERKPGHDSAFWIYSMLVENRPGFYKWMDECNITVSQVHERNDKHTCVTEYRSHLPSLDATIGNIVSIPVGWWVSQEEREYIVDCIKKGW